MASTSSRLLRLIAVFVLAAVALLLGAGPSDAAAPTWMPGFPMRAGNVVIGMFMPVPGATEYKVFRKEQGADFAEIYKGPMNNFNDTAADPSKTYSYKVVPVIGGKDGDPSPEAVLQGRQKISPPDFGGVLSVEQGIQLRWTLVNGAAFYNLYRSVGKEGDYKLLKSLQDTTYMDTDVKPGNTYYYQLSAVDKMSTESDRSKTQTVNVAKKEAQKEAKTHVAKLLKKGKVIRGEDLYELEGPRGVAIGKGGEIYVIERPGIQIMDKAGNYVRRLKFPKDWANATGILLDRDGTIVLAFPEQSVIRYLAPEDGKVVRTVTVKPPKEYEGDASRKPEPMSIFFDKDWNLWVSDPLTIQIIVLNPKGEEIGRIGTLREQFVNKPAKERPEDALTGLGNIRYNAATEKVYCKLTDGRFKVIDAKTRKVEKTFGRTGSGVDEFSNILDFAFRKNGNVMVFDNFQAIIKEYSKDLDYIVTYGEKIDEKSKIPLFGIGGASHLLFLEDAGTFLITDITGNKVTMYTGANDK